MYVSKKSTLIQSIAFHFGLACMMLLLSPVLTAQNVGVETLTPDSTLSIANKVEIGGSHGDVVLTDDLASITFPATLVPNRPMMHMFNDGVWNADRMILAHSPAFTDYGLQYRDTLDQFHFLSGGQHAFSVSVKFGNGQLGLADAQIDPNYTFNVASDTENRIFNIYNNKNTSSTTHGIYARNQGGGSGAKRGGLFGVSGGTGQNIGVMATASGSTMENIALYAFAIGPNALAAHFDAGDVLITEDLLIGTTEKADGYKLNVHGKIIGEEMRIQDVENWPDYVFANDYALLPLEELEANIERENHLPGIPAAAEIESNGFDSGEMHKLTMQKIEELTLYIIGLNKKNQQLKNEISLLRKEIKAIQSN